MCDWLQTFLSIRSKTAFSFNRFRSFIDLFWCVTDFVCRISNATQFAASFRRCIYFLFSFRSFLPPLRTSTDRRVRSNGTVWREECFYSFTKIELIFNRSENIFSCFCRTAMHTSSENRIAELNEMTWQKSHNFISNFSINSIRTFVDFLLRWQINSNIISPACRPRCDIKNAFKPVVVQSKSNDRQRTFFLCS